MQPPSEAPSRTKPVIFGVVLLVAAIAAGYVAGRLAAKPDEFDWGVAAGVWTATGTGLLATATAALAWTTYRDVTGTWKQVELQREDMELRGRPRVVFVALEATGPGHVKSEPGCGIKFEVRNIGLGAAFKVTVEADYTPTLPARLLGDGSTRSGIVPLLAPLETSDPLQLTWQLTSMPSGDEAALHHFTVSGRYMDWRLDETREIEDLTKTILPLEAHIGDDG